MPSDDVRITVQTERVDIFGRVLAENRDVVRRIMEREVQRVVDRVDREMLYGVAEATPTGILGTVQACVEEEYIKPTVRVIRMKSKMEGRKNERQKMDEGSPGVAGTRNPGFGSEGCEL